MRGFARISTRPSWVLLQTAIAASALAGAPSAFAATVDSVLDPLHGCYGTACSDNGTNTPTSTNNPFPSFGFSISPKNQTGGLFIDILVPNNEDTSPSSLSYTISATQTGAHNNGSESVNTSFINKPAWNSGDLGTYTGNAPNSPANPIGAFLGDKLGVGTLGGNTGKYDPAATGFYVYQADLGTNQLLGNSSVTNGPQMSLQQNGSPAGLPLGTYVVAFLAETTTTCSGKPKVCTTSTSYVATAPSGALLETSTLNNGHGGAAPLPAALPL